MYFRNLCRLELGKGHWVLNINVLGDFTKNQRYKKISRIIIQ